MKGRRKEGRKRELTSKREGEEEEGEAKESGGGHSLRSLYFTSNFELWKWMDFKRKEEKMESTNEKNINIDWI